ncbi:MAG: peptidylprolyl isomerase [Bacteroidota bacterium]|nr:peptidylprolyl isomerase [Bacteroidota bacterium]
MNRTILIFSLIAVLSMLSCESMEKKPATFLIETTYGNITVELYDDTPKHKSNFMRLVNRGYYDNLLFHRVIVGFMIQGGDPESKNAKPGKALGQGGPDYTIKSEIKANHFHKRGALAAARKGNIINPEKRSSGSQFYIVTGKKYTMLELNQLEKRVNHGIKNQVLSNYIGKDPELKQKIEVLRKDENFTALDSLLQKLSLKIKNDSIGLKAFGISPERKAVYSTIGGTPTLDGEYTVFGEVVKGMEVVEKIARVPVDKNNRPLNNIVINIKQIH